MSVFDSLDLRRRLRIQPASRGEPRLSARLRRLLDEANAWIFLPRGLGTMLELVWMAESVVKADAAPRPFVLLGDFWRPTVETALAEAADLAI